jgi:hypothetical protein
MIFRENTLGHSAPVVDGQNELWHNLPTKGDEENE